MSFLPDKSGITALTSNTNVDYRMISLNKRQNYIDCIQCLGTNITIWLIIWRRLTFYLIAKACARKYKILRNKLAASFSLAIKQWY